MTLNDSFWYFGTPFSRYAKGLTAAAIEAAQHAGEFVKSGVNVYSPIAHSYQIAVWGNIDPLDGKLWEEVDRPYVRNAFGLIVVMMDGWRDSIGLLNEIREFTTAKKPTVYWQPGSPVPVAEIVRLEGAHNE